MNVLVEDLPRTVCGRPVNTDFRAMVQLELLIQDREVPAEQKVSLGLGLLFTRGLGDLTLTEAWDGLLWYYRGGDIPEPSEPEKPAQGRQSAPSKPRRVYDFEQDAGRIYAAFWQVYGVDLQQTALHWWAFRSMLFALPDSCLQGKIMGYRATDVSKLKGAEKKRVQQLQRLYAIRSDTTEEGMSAAARDRQLRDRAKARYKEALEWKAKQNNK